jgi:response regulator RpfG family c-di-GMP phosphodiesterase
MKSDYPHRILIVEQDTQIKDTIAALLKKENIHTDFADNGERGLEKIKAQKTPYSLIVSAQRLTDMEGTQFLENTRKLLPDSVRFLMAVFSEMQTIVRAVNQSDIHRFIVKPFDDKDFIKSVYACLDLYHAFIEHQRLIKLAKQQNSKLFELNNRLMEAAKSHNTNLKTLDKEIQSLSDTLASLSKKSSPVLQDTQPEISAYVSTSNGVDAQKVKILFSQTIHRLYEQFDDLAQKNGLVMPQIGETST